MRKKRNFTLLAAIMAVFLSIQSCNNAPIKEVWIDELGSSSCYVQDWGTPQINKSVVWTPLTVNGVVYERGIGAHSIGRMLFDLDGKALSISGLAGADDNNLYAGKFQFKIIGDRKELWKSGVVKKGDPIQEFNVDLSGIDKVLLLVEECGDGIMYDHADWINVKVTTRGEVKPIPAWPKAIAKEKYILTPQSPEHPIINNPLVYGARPGNPFLWTIMATGQRPMKFEASGLPDGLKLDQTTGFITGKATTKGEYKVLLKATNDKGRDEKEVLFKIGDEIALTPPMGWNSWNCWGLSVDDEKVRDAARMMNDKLHAHGWTYVNIDDGWEAKERTKQGEILSNEKFPNFKALTDYIHSLGLKFGIYSSPGHITCGGHVGSYQHEEIDAKTWEKWGVDYLKYDHCGYLEIQKNSEEKSIQEPYIVMRKALDKVNRDIVYCVGYGAPNVWNWGEQAGGNQWRTTRDITDEWNVVTAIGFFQDVCAPATAPGKYNDPDMLVIGKLGKGWGEKVHDSYLTADEQYSHLSLWSILSAPLLIGCDMANIDDFTLNLLTNREVIAVDQDPLVAPAVKIMTENGQIWYKKLYDGSYAVGLFHVDPYFILWDQDSAEAIQNETYKMQLDFSKLGIQGEVTVRDLWRQKDLGNFTNNFQADIPYHGVKFVKVTPKK
ncbi:MULTISPECIES: NPCBM/NEW2 domain-containing protein [Dysgonomonas]|uniref:NPCBM/NEW2 domain-containing protein n=1 Tax=Dysgonomonas TaxID=156973 RepID=UPI000929D261|nr:MULTISPECIES: NPCBM/NEW2 domain-containing protein [Dysgonomonas]MBN9302678.1 NPCBM/NEW2 domain-containing protein [Dysgonomonas mossii]OJX58795.1 MAG: alpha-galactosidase [Dysgonomonas sp. 37-18]